MTEEGTPRTQSDPTPADLLHRQVGGSTREDARPPPSAPRRTLPEGGWGWMVVAGGLLTQVVYGLTVRVFGVTYLGLLDRYNGTATATSWVGGINIAATGLFSPIATELLACVSHRWLTLGATVIASGSLMITGFMPRLEFTWLTYGLFTGFGTCVTTTCGLLLVSEYFERRRALAMGIVNLGSGMATLVFSPILVYLYDTYGYTGAFILISGISLHTCISAMTFTPAKATSLRQETENIPNPVTSAANTETCEDIKIHGSSAVEHYQSFQQQKPQQEHGPEPGSSNKVTVQIDPQQATTKMGFFRRYLSLVTSLRFAAFLQLLFVFAFNLSITSAFTPALAIEKGLDSFQGATLLSAMAVSNMISPVAGILLDIGLLRRRRFLIYGLCQALAGIACLLYPVSTSYAGLLVLAIMLGLFSSVVMSQRVTLVGDILGRARIRDGVALMTVVFSIGALFGRIITGMMKDRLGRYSGAFYLAGGSTVGSALLFLIAVCSQSSDE